MEELKKKIDEAMKCQFVGEVIFTEDELAKIYARANSLLRVFFKRRSIHGNRLD